MTWEQLPCGARDCLRTLTAAGHAAYPVGGCVRDLLLGKEPGDIDVCTSAHPEAVMALFAGAIPTGIAHGTVTVPTPGGNVEITTFRREEGYADARHPDAVTFDVGLIGDLSRRDFTVNAMALTEDGTVVDPFGGREDLRRQIIRCVGEADRRFSEDALRMLRAVRFSAQLDFTIAPETAAALFRNASLAVKLSGERIKAEMEKTLLSSRPERIGVMADAGLLDHLYRVERGIDFTSLAALPAAPEARWRGFCQVSGFPIAVLPVTRKLRRAVERPETGLIPTLALSAQDLIQMGLIGPEISAAQRRLALHVLEHPGDNTVEALKVLLEQ